HARPPAGEHPRAAECVAAARALWDSWAPDGTPRPVAHHGRYFAVEGEFTVARCPQGRPVTVLAGDSPEDRELAASAADIVLVPHTTFDAARARYAEVKGRLAAHGRAHDELKVLLRVAFALDDADGTGAREPFTGSPDAVAALLTEYVTEGAADGFVLVPYASDGLDGFVDRVVPLLQDRGAFRRTYDNGSTLRSHLGIAAPVWKG
ncbi:LLM class flavin-dependent oxidoreductase, partial [Streptomyces sp. SID9727]|uniref:LLM class flavin-dependent oxidoreductase n=1 Tax=Streptomyces sp. SID9727 TaxID=2706114 RepID=UPI0013CA4EED